MILAGLAWQDDFESLMREVIKLQPEALSSVKPTLGPKTLVELQTADLAVWEQRHRVQVKLRDRYEDIRDP